MEVLLNDAFQVNHDLLPIPVLGEQWLFQGLAEITPSPYVDHVVRWRRLGEPLPESVEKRLRFVGRAGDDREQQEGDLVFTRCALLAFERANFLAGGEPRARREKQLTELVEYSIVL